MHPFPPENYANPPKITHMKRDIIYARFVAICTMYFYPKISPECCLQGGWQCNMCTTAITMCSKYGFWYCYVGGDIYLRLRIMLLVGMLWADVMCDMG